MIIAILHQVGGLSVGFFGVRVKKDLMYIFMLRKKNATPNTAAAIT